MLNQDSFNEKHVNVERRCVGAANGIKFTNVKALFGRYD
jgi:hypothetical protein